MPGFLIWLVAIGAMAWICWRQTKDPDEVPATPWTWLGIIGLIALAVRLFWINTVPQGAYIDEMFTLRNTLAQFEKPFDPFGMTPLINEGWVVTSNLYLTFNTIIIRLFGVSYLSIKLFSVIPGIAACGFFFLACTELFARRIAVVVALLFALSEWHIRLSRYGWDASFLVMTLTAAIWLLLRSRRGRPFSACLAGVCSALGLYSYINGRLCVVALGGYLTLLWIRTRSRDDLVRLGAFSAGVLVTAAPFIAYAVTHFKTTWVRTGELSIFHRDHPLQLLIHNIWGHALMFNVHGGAYARDNYPAVPMLDLLTGALFIVGLVALALKRKTFPSGLLLATLICTLLGGILSASQEGAPYVYRASAAVVPALLIAGLGFMLVAERVTAWRPAIGFARAELLLGIATLLVVTPLNLYGYFQLELRNTAGARVMGNKYRVLGRTIARVEGPVYLVLPSALQHQPKYVAPEERYSQFNGPVVYEFFGRDIFALALIAFSGEYNWHHTMKQNFADSRIGLMDEPNIDKDLTLPIKLLFGSDDSTRTAALRLRYGQAGYHEEVISNEMGNPMFRLVTIGTDPH